MKSFPHKRAQNKVRYECRQHGFGRVGADGMAEEVVGLNDCGSGR